MKMESAKDKKKPTVLMSYALRSNPPKFCYHRPVFTVFLASVNFLV